jgi:hypothetical protein
LTIATGRSPRFGRVGFDVLEGTNRQGGTFYSVEKILAAGVNRDAAFRGKSIIRPAR